jgi:hypothetical protein
VSAPCPRRCIGARHARSSRARRPRDACRRVGASRPRSAAARAPARRRIGERRHPSARRRSSGRLRSVAGWGQARDAGARRTPFKFSFPTTQRHPRATAAAEESEDKATPEAEGQAGSELDLEASTSPPASSTTNAAEVSSDPEAVSAAKEDGGLRFRCAHGAPRFPTECALLVAKPWLFGDKHTREKVGAGSIYEGACPQNRSSRCKLPANLTVLITIGWRDCTAGNTSAPSCEPSPSRPPRRSRRPLRLRPQGSSSTSETITWRRSPPALLDKQRAEQIPRPLQARERAKPVPAKVLGPRRRVPGTRAAHRTSWIGRPKLPNAPR